MRMHVLETEESIIRDIKDGKAVSLERALLVLSGLKTDEELRSYQRSIDAVFDRFFNKCGAEFLSYGLRPPPYLHLPIAKCLFEYLWNSKPKRFGVNFLLTDVVDAQLDPDVHRCVGTCIGLTSLYSVLALRAGVKLTLLVGSDHLLSRLRVGQRTIDIDHTDPQGFDCRNGEGFRELPLPTLTANVLNSRGLRSEKIGRFATAMADYEKAILVNPEYANAWNNRGNMRFWGEDVEGAVADYTEALRLDPCFCEAYCNRGMARQRLGRCDEARQDYAVAMRMNSEYSDARKCLELLDALERRKQAHTDFPAESKRLPPVIPNATHAIATAIRVIPNACGES